MTELHSADIARILRLLPHRYPFLLVDRVEEIDGLDSAVGVKNVTMNEPHFQGHFPGNPVMPGVLVVEAMAQTAGVLIGIGIGAEDKGAGILFMSIEKAKFRRPIVPGDVLRMRVSRLRGQVGGKVWRFAGRAEVDGKLACEAEFTAMMSAPE